MWSKPVVLFATSGVTNDPVLVADPSGDVHLLFWYTEEREESNPGGIMMYSRLHQGVWSKPIDVQDSADGSRQPSPAVDQNGYLHVVWTAPRVHQIYYSRAYVSEAGSARAWTSPVPLSEQDASNGAFAQNNDIAAVGHSLHVLYTAGGRVIYLRSDDGGRAWLPPTTVADARGQQVAQDDPRIVADAQGRVFATWTQYSLPDGWPPTGTYFARSVDGGNSWTQPVRIAGPDRALLAPATDGQTNLYLMWVSRAALGDAGGQWSKDGGQTWSSPERILSRVGVGLAGFPRMAFDSQGVLHVALSAGLDQSPSGVVTAEWNGQVWSQETLISQGSIGKQGVEHPTLAISQGNQVHVAWEDDGHRIWYASQLLDAPSVPAAPLPPPTRQPVQDPTPPRPASTPASLLVGPTPTPLLVSVDMNSAPSAEVAQSSAQPLPPLVGASLISLLLLGAVAVVHLRRLS